MYQISYDGTNKKVMWQEMWRHEFLDALERDAVVIVPVGSCGATRAALSDGCGYFRAVLYGRDRGAARG